MYLYIYWRTLKRNTWIAALIYVSKKKAKQALRLYAKKGSFCK